jgi:hypothetical protein
LAPVTPDTFVSPAGNELGNSAIPNESDQTFGREVELEEAPRADGARSEYELELERVQSFHRMVALEPWAPHQPKRQRTSAENDFWLVQS